METPCKTCKICTEPEECTRLTCPIWREWFLWAWDQARLKVLLKFFNGERK